MSLDHPDVLERNLAVVAPFSPPLVWDVFARLSCVPRPSHHEARVQQWLEGFLAAKGLAVSRDAADNLVARVPASPGREAAPTVVLQAHVDMVPVKDAAASHDFERDPIRLVADTRDGETIVRADRTTLGADNGIGVALAIAAALDSAVPHGPLELLLTVNEEAGMTGAKAVRPETVGGRLLLNLDTEEDDQLYIGCAGAMTTFATFELPDAPVTADAPCVAIDVAGLRGGHSGMEIDRGRGNAIRILADVLDAVGVGAFRLATCSGGTARNAIPDRARAVLVLERTDAATVAAIADGVAATWRARLGDADSGLTIRVAPLAPAERPTRALARHDAHVPMMRTILLLPHGVIALHPEDPSLVETSNNVAVLRHDDDGAPAGSASSSFTLEVSTRSLDPARLAAVADDVATTCRDVGHATTEFTTSYPPWKPDFAAPLLATSRAAYRDLFGDEPIVRTIHAGLECGLLAEALPGVQMVSMGPRIEEPHTALERVYPASVERFWRYLVLLLARLSEPPK